MLLLEKNPFHVLDFSHVNIAHIYIIPLTLPVAYLIRTVDDGGEIVLCSGELRLDNGNINHLLDENLFPV